MKKITEYFVAIFVLVLVLTGCGYGSNSTTITSEGEEFSDFIGETTEPEEVAEPLLTKSGFMLSPGIMTEVSDQGFSYIVLEEKPSDYEEMVANAEQIVRKWWNDDETFEKANDILPTEIFGEIRGFQRDEYIFIDFNSEDALATLVHEMIHLQNERSLLYDDYLGMQLMEMVVEAITIKLVGEAQAGNPTDNYLFFVQCPNLFNKFEELEKSFKNKESAEEAYSRIFGKNAKKIVSTLDCYYNLNECFASEFEYQFFLNSILGIDVQS